MKTIEELGISPTPWSIWHKTKSRVKDSLGNSIADCGDYIDYCVSDAKIYEARYNARLIAAAPDLYRSLREAVVESCVSYCGEHPIHCHKKDGECFVQKWRDVLAKASGEEMRHD